MFNLFGGGGSTPAKSTVPPPAPTSNRPGTNAVRTAGPSFAPPPAMTSSSSSAVPVTVSGSNTGGGLFNFKPASSTTESGAFSS